MMAAQNNIDYFYEISINLNMRDSKNQSLLHYAVRTSATKVIDYLLENEIDVNMIDYMGETPLFDCARKSKVSIAKQLIRRFANVNASNNKGELAIHLACLKADYDMVRLLIENGSQTDLLTKDGHSIIHYAIKSNQIDFLKYIIKQTKRYVNELDNQSNSMIHVACDLGFSNITDFLLECNHNIHFKNNQKETPLFKAVKSGSLETVQILLNRGAYLDIKNKFGETVIDISARLDNRLMNQLLLDFLQSSQYKKNIKKYPLRYAIIKEDINLLNRYLYEGTVDIKDDYLLTAYDYAVKHNLKDFIKGLRP